LTLKTANNVIIRNGKLGLSSHHGIRGLFNKNIQLENIEVRDFEVAGILLSGKIFLYNFFINL
jgi:hypothetical protein